MEGYIKLASVNVNNNKINGPDDDGVFGDYWTLKKPAI